MLPARAVYKVLGARLLDSSRHGRESGPAASKAWEVAGCTGHGRYECPPPCCHFHQLLPVLAQSHQSRLGSQPGPEISHERMQAAGRMGSCEEEGSSVLGPWVQFLLPSKTCRGPFASLGLMPNVCHQVGRAAVPQSSVLPSPPLWELLGVPGASFHTCPPCCLLQLWGAANSQQSFYPPSLSQSWKLVPLQSRDYGNPWGGGDEASWDLGSQARLQHQPQQGRQTWLQSGLLAGG